MRIRLNWFARVPLAALVYGSGYGGVRLIKNLLDDTFHTLSLTLGFIVVAVTFVSVSLLLRGFPRLLTRGSRWIRWPTGLAFFAAAVLVCMQINSRIGGGESDAGTALAMAVGFVLLAPAIALLRDSPLNVYFSRHERIRQAKQSEVELTREDRALEREERARNRAARSRVPPPSAKLTPEDPEFFERLAESSEEFKRYVEAATNRHRRQEGHRGG